LPLLSPSTAYLRTKSKEINEKLYYFASFMKKSIDYITQNTPKRAFLGLLPTTLSDKTA
jgi:hypothetical protein